MPIDGAIRVTEPLNYFKEPWYVDWVCRVGKREASRISKAAMKVGTIVDEAIKAYTIGEQILLNNETPQEVENCLKAFEKWEAVYKPGSITPCTRLFATIEGHEVTGEPDIMVDDVLVDIKCSSSISPKHWVQVNMYRQLMALNLKSHAHEKVGILRLDKKTGSYEYVVKDYNPKFVDCWIGLLRAFVLFNKENDNDGVEL